MNSSQNTTKVCHKCQNSFQSSFFSKKSDSRDGLNTICNSCQSIKAKNDYKKRDKKKMAQQVLQGRIKRLSDPIESRKLRLKLCLAYAKRRAKVKNIDFDLDYLWIDQNTALNCPIFHTPFTFCEYGKAVGMFDRKLNNSPSIDRIDNEKGYTKDNCVVISVRANLLKGQASISELMALTSFYQTKLSKAENT